MSEGNIELVKRVMGLMSRAGTDPDAAPQLFALMSPDVHIDMSRRVFNPDVYEGHEGLRRLGREVGEVWEDFRIEPEEFIASRDRVIVIETRRGRGRESGLEVEQRSGVVWTLRDGQVVAMETDLDPGEARALAEEG